MDQLSHQFEQVLNLIELRSTMASDQAMQMFRQFSNEGRAIVHRTLNDTRLVGIKDNAHNVWNELIQWLRNAKETASQLTNPRILGEQLQIIFRDEIARNNLFFVCIGLTIGTTCGYFIGTWIARPYYPSPVMKAVACIAYSEPDNVIPTLVKVPSYRFPSDLLVRVRAASIHRIDDRIINGYGKHYRRMIQNYNTYDHSELPLVIGRACAGIVEGVGRNSSLGFEIGDEVWMSSPWYEAGCCSQLVVVPETRVSRKPFIIGFEGAASLPYSGCAALTALQEANLEETTSEGKRVLVIDGCSPTGCVLTQLLHRWSAFVTATCNVRSVPVIQALGAEDVIAFNSDDHIYELEERDLLLKELLVREPFDYVFLTTSSSYNRDFIWKFIKSGGKVIDAVEKRIASDEYGFFMRLLCSMYVRIEKSIYYLFKLEPNYGGPHICHRSLDRLASYVNEGILQTVVDQVFTPDDAEKAISHIASTRSIGSTIVTFRS